MGKKARKISGEKLFKIVKERGLAVELTPEALKEKGFRELVSHLAVAFLAERKVIKLSD